MSLSSELISQFAKITKDKTETKTETTVYGTIVNYNGSTYVKLDGSDLLTPISSTTETQSGERVTVLIKNHTATVTGNISSPAARTDDVKELGTKISEFDVVVANKVSTEQLEAQIARIDTLTTDNVTIKEKLTANEAVINNLDATYAKIDELNATNAEIQNLQTKKLDASIADIKYATIENLEATNAEIDNLDATYAKITSLEATKADIKNLDSKYATIENLKATNADVDKLEANSLTAESAVIKDLEADVAKVDTLIFGSASGSSIQTSFANAVIAQLGNAQIKSAMIDSITANQIQSGQLITNNVTVTSSDGKLLISDETIQIKDSNRVRVQIGKDSSGDYSINIWDADGKLMFSEGGLTESAIKESIIRDDMVSDTANISASKLNISSLFTVINEDGSNTLNSSKIAMDDEGQTLDVAFTTMTSNVNDLGETVKSQGTSISTIQGQISSKVWQQDINDATGELNTQYSTLDQKVDGISQTVASHTTQIQNKADSSTVTTVNNKVTSLETNLNGFKTSVSETYSTKKELETAEENIATAQQTATTANSTAQRAQSVADANYNLIKSLTTKVSTAETNIAQNTEQIALCATKTEVEEIQIGGRNLLKNSRHIHLNSNNSALYPVSYTTETENGREFRRYKRTETSLTPTTMSLYSSIPVTQITDYLTNQEITFSFLIRCSHETTTSVMNRIVIDGTSYNFATEKTHNVGAEWQRISVTATMTQEYEMNDSNVLQFNPLLTPIPSGAIDAFYIDVCEWKIEKGNKATDWTPAPEDIDNKFLKYSTTTEMNAAINVKADGIVSTVSSTYTTKTEFKDLDVGGRNLVLDSSMKEKTDKWSLSSENAYSFAKGYCEIYRESTSGSRTFNNQSTNINSLLKPDNLAGSTFTLSAEIKLLDGYSITDSSMLFYRCNTTSLSSGFQEISIPLGGATAEWKKVYSTFTFGNHNFDGSCQVCIALANIAKTGVCVRNIKLERGDKATDWTPAPEDTSTDVNTLQETVNGYSDYGDRLEKAETLIAQLSNAISFLVRDAKGQSQMIQSSTEAEYAFFSTEEIDKAIEDTSATLDALNTEYGGTKATVEVLQQTLADYGERVKFSTYEDEPCIILYENDSDHKQIITNTRRIFVQTTNNVDTILGITDYESVRSNKIIANESVQVSSYIFKTLDDGCLVLSWEEVSN